jgi:hypothetical protein
MRHIWIGAISGCVAGLRLSTSNITDSVFEASLSSRSDNVSTPDSSVLSANVPRKSLSEKPDNHSPSRTTVASSSSVDSGDALFCDSSKQKSSSYAGHDTQKSISATVPQKALSAAVETSSVETQRTSSSLKERGNESAERRVKEVTLVVNIILSCSGAFVKRSFEFCWFSLRLCKTLSLKNKIGPNLMILISN